MGVSLDEYLQQQLGERPAKPQRPRKAPAPGVSEQYRRFEKRFDDWASGQLDRATELERKRPQSVMRFAAEIYRIYRSY